MKKITTCSKACVECGFTKDGTTDTLYAEMYDIAENAIVFPCHMFLKKHTGSENTGVETLKEIQVCRGYVAFMLKNKIDVIYQLTGIPAVIWEGLLDSIEPEELDNICSLEELEARHIGLRNKINMRGRN